MLETFVVNADRSRLVGKAGVTNLVITFGGNARRVVVSKLNLPAQRIGDSFYASREGTDRKWEIRCDGRIVLVGNFITVAIAQRGDHTSVDAIPGAITQLQD